MDLPDQETELGSPALQVIPAELSGEPLISFNSWQIDGETMGKMTDFISLSSKITAESDCSYESKDACCLEEKL